jgi:hypothetical protein
LRATLFSRKQAIGYEGWPFNTASIWMNYSMALGWRKARSRARIRLIDSIQSKEGVEVVGGDLFTEEGRIIEAFSFYYARLVVCASEDERLIARWAQAEAARAEQVLIKDHKNLDVIARTYIANIQAN